jgi:serine/threonine protein kinase
MADSDWHKYRQLRGKELPSEFPFQDVVYQQRKLLKRDFYAAVGIYEHGNLLSVLPRQVLLKIYHTDALWGLPLGWLGRWLARREIDAYRALADVPGIPRMLATHGEAGMVREFVPGCNLKEYRAQALPDRYFHPELARILADVHARGMSHNDLAKPENVLVDEAGRPVLIDFQIALGPRLVPVPGLAWLARRFLSYMQGVDRYHLRKHHTHDHPDDFSPEELRRARQKGTLLWLHGVVLRRPYRAVRHFVLQRWLLEPRTKPTVQEAPRRAA